MADLTAKQKLALKIGQMKPEYDKNPYWEFKDGEIKHTDSGEIFNINEIETIRKPIQELFKLHYESYGSEAQVVVLRRIDWDNLHANGPVGLPIVAETAFMVVTMLPQDNTHGNTSVSESVWQRFFGNKIVPLMRIHSHHVLQAYQSITDWTSLNSGTLEVVFGTIFEDVPQIAYWLDTRGESTKDIVFRTLDFGEIVHCVPNGKDRYTAYTRNLPDTGE